MQANFKGIRRDDTGMGRTVPLAAALLVSVSVFTWLSGPLLETQFGTGALIVTYAGLAATVGILTYLLVRRLDTGTDYSSEKPPSAVTINVEETEIEEEMQQLKDD